MATIADVASMAGVSTMTVSRVLNETGKVSPQKREAVMRAIATLNYHPNLVARSLATSRSGTIGVIVTEMGNPVYPSYVEGVSERLRKAGLDMIVYYASSFQTAQNGIHTLLSKQVDGLIVLPLEIHEDAKVRETFVKLFSDSIQQSGKPLVMIGNSFLMGFPNVAEDYAGGAAMAVEYLYEMGHRHIGYIRCACREYPWNERDEGFYRTIERLGCVLNDRWVLGVSENFEEIMSGVDEWVDGLLQTGEALPTALYCANDLMALGTLYAIKKHGLRVPEDISIIGHDGNSYTRYTFPLITTIALTPHKTGIAVAQILIDSMGGKKHVTEKKLMAPRLKQGATVRNIYGVE